MKSVYQIESTAPRYKAPKDGVKSITMRGGAPDIAIGS